MKFTLRGLLAGVAFLAVAMAWWCRLQTVEILRDDGTTAARFQVRRNWSGQLVAYGTQAWYLPDGQCFRRQAIEGARLVDASFVGPGRFGEPVYPPHRPPDPPSAEYVGWLRADAVPVSTDLPSSGGALFSYP